MSDIVIHNQFDKLPESLRQYAINRVGKKAIKDLTPNEVKRHCNEIIAKAFADDGKFQVTSEMLSFQSLALFEELKGKFKDLTIDEVKEAFRLGIRGETGAYFGLCAKTYHQFIKHYFERKERSEAMRVYLDQFGTGITDKKLTDDEKREQMIKGIRLAYEAYCRCGELPFYPAPYYDFIKNELKLTNWTKEQRDEIEREAREQYTNKLANDRKNRIINAEKFQQIINNLNTDQTFFNHLKKVALKKFFEVCKLTNYKL